METKQIEYYQAKDLKGNKFCIAAQSEDAARRHEYLSKDSSLEETTEKEAKTCSGFRFLIEKEFRLGKDEALWLGGINTKDCLAPQYKCW